MPTWEPTRHRYSRDGIATQPHKGSSISDHPTSGEAVERMNLRLPFRKAPKDVEGRVDELVQALDGDGWKSAKKLAWLLDTDDRTVRAIAAASHGRIISGQKGYCLIEEATVEEANHAASWLRHQAAEMTRRAHQIEQAMHRRGAA